MKPNLAARALSDMLRHTPEDVAIMRRRARRSGTCIVDDVIDAEKMLERERARAAHAQWPIR